MEQVLEYSRQQNVSHVPLRLTPQSAMGGNLGIAGAQQRRLQPGKGHVAARAIEQRARKGEGLGIAAGGLGLDRGAARSYNFV